MTEEHEQEQQQNGILDDPLALSNVEQGVQNHGKRKINYRHTTEQIQRLEG